MKTVAIITSRWQSERLPGKALIDICGKPMLRWVVDAALGASTVDEVVVATTLNSSPIIDYCRDSQIPCYAGSEDDILDRLYQVMRLTGATKIVRIWGDSPLIVSPIIEMAVSEATKYEGAYVYTPYYPMGQQVAVFGAGRLHSDWHMATEGEDRHWYHKYCISTPTAHKVPSMQDLSCLDLSVDTPEDLERIREIVRKRDN